MSFYLSSTSGGVTTFYYRAVGFLTRPKHLPGVNRCTRAQKRSKPKQYQREQTFTLAYLGENNFMFKIAIYLIFLNSRSFERQTLNKQQSFPQPSDHLEYLLLSFPSTLFMKILFSFSPTYELDISVSSALDPSAHVNEMMSVVLRFTCGWEKPPRIENIFEDKFSDSAATK